MEVIRGVVGSFVCTEKASAGTFAVPAAVLSTLPIARQWTSDGDPTGMLAVSSQPVAESVKFTAPGVDIGYFQYTVEYIKNVAYQ